METIYKRGVTPKNEIDSRKSNASGDSIDTFSVEYDANADVYLVGESILSKGESSDFVCELLSGTAKVIRDGDVVATLNSGEIFGTVAALTGSRRLASIIASEPCMVRKISRHKFRLLLQTQPDILELLR